MSSLAMPQRARAWLLVARHGGKCPRNSDLIGPERSPALCQRLRNAAGGATASVDAGTFCAGAFDRGTVGSGGVLVSITIVHP